LGVPAEKNPWQANSLEWRTPTMPPGHGNFGKELPVVYRWPYDFNVPGAKDDFVPQDVPNSDVELAEGFEGTEIKAEKT
jgi:cytochrome c oxidase subunit 1